MRIQRVQANNNYNNKPSFGALILDDSLKRVLNKLSYDDLQEIKKVREKLKHTKYYDLLVKNNENILREIEPTFVPKDKDNVKLDGILCKNTTRLLEDENGYETRLDWRDPHFDYSRHVTTFDFETSRDAIHAKAIVDDSPDSVQTFDSFARDAYANLIPAIKSWADICTDVLEKSMAFMASGKSKVLNESEKLIEDLMSTKKDEISPETINTLRNYFKNNSDYGNLYTADDMLELLKDMFAEDILYKKDILTTPIKEGDSSILMYVADIFPTEENAKKYDKIISILKKVQGINYNFRDKSNTSFLEKVMMSENFKLLDLIKDEPLEYYPELDYAYQNIQNPNFKNKVKQLNIILKNTDGLTASDIKSELQSIAFQNTVNRKV